MIKENKYSMNPLAGIGMMFHGVVYDKITVFQLVQVHYLQGIELLHLISGKFSMREKVL